MPPRRSDIGTPEQIDKPTVSILWDRLDPLGCSSKGLVLSEAVLVLVFVFEIQRDL